MFREPHPADARGTCSRCGDSYHLCEGCQCEELDDDELDEMLDARGEAETDRYEARMNNEPSGYESDQAQSRWEAWRTKER
jgi:hypothetical protein